MRKKPVETMNAALPRLRRITGEYAVAGDVKIRPADIYVLQPAIASPASSWSATPLRTPARLPVPAPTRCSPTSRSSATSTSPPGLRPRAWARTRSPPSMMIRSSRLATPGRCKGLKLPQGHDRDRAILACAALGALPGVVRRRRLRRMRNAISAGSNRRAHSSSSSSLSSSA